MNGRPWTAADTATLERLNAIGCPDDLIATITGHCRDTVRRQRTARQIPPAYSVRYSGWQEMPRPALSAILGLTF